MSVSSRQRPEAIAVAQRFAKLGFKLFATRGTAAAFRAVGLQCQTVLKVNEGRPNLVDLIKDRHIDLIINTPTGAHAFEDERSIRRAAAVQAIPCITTLSAGRAAAEGIEASRGDELNVLSLQQLHEGMPDPVEV